METASVLEEHGTVRQCQLTSAKSTSQIDVIQRLRAATAIQSKFGECAFSHAGPSAWNSLLDSIRNEPNSAIFWKHLKTHFFVQQLMFVNFYSLILLSVDSVTHLCPFCNSCIINVR